MLYFNCIFNFVHKLLKIFLIYAKFLLTIPRLVSKMRASFPR